MCASRFIYILRVQEVKSFGIGRLITVCIMRSLAYVLAFFFCQSVTPTFCRNIRNTGVSEYPFLQGSFADELLDDWSHRLWQGHLYCCLVKDPHDRESPWLLDEHAEMNVHDRFPPLLLRRQRRVMCFCGLSKCLSLWNVNVTEIIQTQCSFPVRLLTAQPASR